MYAQWHPHKHTHKNTTQMQKMLYMLTSIQNAHTHTCKMYTQWQHTNVHKHTQITHIHTHTHAKFLHTDINPHLLTWASNYKTNTRTHANIYTQRRPNTKHTHKHTHSMSNSLTQALSSWEAGAQTRKSLIDWLMSWVARWWINGLWSWDCIVCICFGDMDKNCVYMHAQCACVSFIMFNLCIHVCISMSVYVHKICMRMIVNEYCF